MDRQPSRSGSVSGRKDSKGNKEKPRMDKDKTASKSPSHVQDSSFFSTFNKLRSKKSSTLDPMDSPGGPSSPSCIDPPAGLRPSITSIPSVTGSPLSVGPLPSPKPYESQTDYSTTSSVSLDKLDSTVPSIPEPIKKGHVRILLPNKQRTMIFIKKPEAPLDEALKKPMRLRFLEPGDCLAYRLVPQKRALGWKTPIGDVDGEEISVEDRFNTTFENPHRFVSKGQMALSYCDVCRTFMMAGLRCQLCGYKAHKHCSKRATLYCDMNPGTRASNTASLMQKLRDTDDPLFHVLQAEPNVDMDEEVEITRVDINNVSRVYCTSTGDKKTSSNDFLKRPGHYGSAPSLHLDDGTMATSMEEGAHKGSVTPASMTPASMTPDPGKSYTATPGREPSPSPEPGLNTLHPGTHMVRLNTVPGHLQKGYSMSLEDGQTTSTHGAVGSGGVAGSGSLRDNASEVIWEISMDQVKLSRKVGSGAYGTVYKGEWHGDVAVKKLNVTMPTPELREVFANEVKVLMNTRHTRILLFMACILEPQLAIVTQWCEGSSLYTLLHVNDHRFEQEQNITIAMQIAQGMDYLHSRRIIHRDLKSANVLLEHNTRFTSNKINTENMLQLINVKIADFGLSAMQTALGANQPKAAKQQPLGSLLWMAPEVITMKPNPYSEASDVYAFGIILFELITSTLPFPKVRNRDQLLFMIGSGNLRPELESAKTNLSKVPRQLKKMFQECVAFQRGDRPGFRQIDFELRNSLFVLPKVTRSASLPSLANKPLGG